MQLTFRNRNAVLAYIVFGVWTASNATFADSIVIDGQTHKDVVVRESATRYLVEVPQDGTVISVSKDEVTADAVTIEPGTSRDALHRQWEVNSRYVEPDTREAGAKSAAPINEAGVKRDEEPILITNRGTRDSDVRGKASDANDTMPIQGSDVLYMHYDAHPVLSSGPNVPVSYPGTGGLDAVRAPRTADYVLHEQGGRSAAVANLPDNSGMGLAGGGFGAGAGGNTGFGGRGGGFGGGAGGGGFGGGGPVFSNISELFFTIDDRLVGETLAVIGMQSSVGR